jgi:phosphoribosylformimino-5-aminoimidazole carboxamide ribotide isomerase
MSIQIIPAIDLIGGQCVRLHKGRFEELTTYEIPVQEMLGHVLGAGFRKVHIVDLDGARAGEPLQLELIAGLARKFDIHIQTGGGYRSSEQVKRALNAGIGKIIIGSAAVRNPLFLKKCLEEFGGERIILAADVTGGQVRVAAWEEESGQTIQSLLDEFIPNGLKTVLITDIERDGTLAGPDVELYAGLKKEYPEIEIIASGGIGSVSHIQSLSKAGIHAVVLGKALYENKVSLTDLSSLQKVYAG